MSQDLKKALFTVSDGVIGAAILLAAGVYGGGWLDSQFHTSPWLSVSLAMLGGALGLGRMVYKATKIGEAANDQPIPKRSVVKPSSEISRSASTGGVRQRNPYDDLEDEEN
jgi:F0F1-type ATP synthase assembly protein I